MSRGAGRLAGENRQGRAGDQDDKAAGLKHPEDGQ